uniref:Uncharacterized protein n=1 Tax=Ursus americanus TaxID=9643 RepID=A0A452S0F9_URSAM
MDGPRRYYAKRNNSANPPVHGQMMEGADKQGAGEQGRPVRQNVYQDYRPQFHRGPPQQRQPKEDIKEEDKKNQGYEIQGQHPSQHRHPENLKPHNGKETKVADPPGRAEQMLAHQLYCLYTIVWFTRPTRKNEYEVPAIRNAQKVGAKDLRCLLFAH